MFVSVIIPVIKINHYIKESISHLLNLDYPDFEILILPNEVSGEEIKRFSHPKIKIIPTKESRPAIKRDLGSKQAQGEILAFLDDDAFPSSDWLLKGVKHFENVEVGAVGGPAVTPKDDPFFAQISGAVYTSFLGGGNLSFRYWPKGQGREVDDWPSVNLLVRKDIFLKVGGFDSQFWPGEDTQLCLRIVQQKKKIIYDPEVLVWHHRRPSLKAHLKQVWNYGLHRGYFVKRFPHTSLKLNYFLPSLFILFLLSGFSWFLFPSLFKIYLAVLLVYFFLLVVSGMVEAFRHQNVLLGISVMPMIVLTHLSYGSGFIIGLLKKELKS